MLANGTKLGPYEIIAPLGAGGMGEVYRARDTRLGRDVAVKVLPAHLSANPDVRARFEREARTVSSLNDPHICALYDIGREGEIDYLVMELVEGETLAARLAKGALPLADVLRIGGQIADALDKAHRAGVVHRDLKPGNVMLARGEAKLMDFGLARVTGLAGPASGSGVTMAALTRTPTVASPLTAEGTLVGTFQYMSPEQLEGNEADARADVWALGCVLYEMATGKRAFEGKSQASLIGAIMSSEPSPVSTVTPTLPPALDKLVRACLAKDPERRVATAHDVALQLAWIAEGGSSSGHPMPATLPARGKPAFVAWGVAALALVAALAFAALWWRGAAQPPRVLRFAMPIPSTLAPRGPLRAAPDGHAVAFTAVDSSGTRRVWVRTFDDLEWHALPGTEGAERPFWSPDSRWLGFMVGSKLKKVPVNGGPAETVGEVPGGSDGAWTASGMILLDGNSVHPLIRAIPAAGGIAQEAVARDTTKRESDTGWPEALPNGKHFLYAQNNADPEKSEIRMGEFGSRTAVRVMAGGGRVEYAPPGWLLFERDGALLVQRFDAGSGKVSGEPHTLVDQVGKDRGNDMAYFSASKNGVLVFSQANSSQRQIEWLDRHGKVLDQALPPGPYGSMALSPDGRYLAYTTTDAGSATSDIWLRDLQRGVSSRFTTDAANDIWPAWSPDSRRLYWASDRKPNYAVYGRRLDSAGADSLVFSDAKLNVGPVEVSRDGNWLSVMATVTGGTWDVLAVPLHGGAPVPIATDAKFSETRARFSPDGRWVAYDSDQSGRMEVYVRPFPGPGAPVQISNTGGGGPVWRGDGRELFFRTIDQHQWSVDIKLGDPIEAGTAAEMFPFPIGSGVGNANVGLWTATADGQRLLINTAMQSQSALVPTVVFGWNAGLKK